MKAWILVSKISMSALVIAAMFYGGYQFLSGPTFKIQNVEVKLKNEASYSVIFSQIKESLDFRLMSLFGDYIWSVDLEKVLQLVEQDERIKEIKVTRILPSTLQVYVLPHTPIANILVNKTAKLYPVSRNGELLPAVLAKDANDGPILRGEIFIKNAKLRQQSLNLLSSLPVKGMLSQKEISEVSYDNKKGFQLIVQPSGATVLVGFEDFSRRLMQAQRVVEYLENKQLSGRIIDARFAKKVVVKLRNDP